ncbi:peptidoglycan DD-metalloendopeptidase family protein [Clostridium neuense]|uniref:Peptidoglycan DD-metalloendopeptidase family protein n=1 Tax=Clostridium neuense TaxID=1728934 RepID=A0ABW8TFF8_9CLOT
MNNDWNKNQNKNQSKFINLFKKDGFYIALFVCLCIIAGVAAYVNLKPKSRSVSSVRQTQQKVDKSHKDSKTSMKLSKDEEKNNAASKNIENAEQVNKNTNLTKKTEQNSVPASTSNVVKKLFVKPIQNGSVAVKYDTWYSKNGKYTNVQGEYIKPDKDMSVSAAMDGVVKAVDGGKVTILNDNSGYITIYDNLDEKSIAVKPNDSVKQGQSLGKIGDSNYSNKLITDTSCVYFEIDQKQKDGTYLAVDPEKILNTK